MYVATIEMGDMFGLIVDEDSETRYKYPKYR